MRLPVTREFTLNISPTTVSSGCLLISSQVFPPSYAILEAPAGRPLLDVLRLIHNP